MTTMTDDERVESYKAYLAAFNNKDFEGIKSYLSPDCTVIFDGRQVKDNREEMLPTYPDHWQKWPTPIELREIRPIENGVWVTLRNLDTEKELELEYYYDEEDLQIQHVVKDVRPY